MQRALAIGERALPDAARAIHTMQWAALADFRGGLDKVEPALRALAASTPAPTGLRLRARLCACPDRPP